jgi:glycosyltransferase involved in cell wall biosynthesis
VTADDPGDEMVSVVIIFKDEEQFLAESVDSVLAQTHRHWELLLVDDGSTDASTALARALAAGHGPRIRYLEHEGHANRGMSASRNVGIASARASYLAFLDADDVWAPTKLERQLARLRAEPEAGFVYGPLLRWRSWTGQEADAGTDDLMGVGRRKYGRHPLADQVVAPPQLVHLMLRDDYHIPGGALFRRSALDAIGGFEETFRGMYEDAVVMVKLCLRYPVLVTDDVLYHYRMHDRSCTHLNSSEADTDAARASYLQWIGGHLDNEGLRTPALARSLAAARRSSSRKRRRRARLTIRILALGRRIVPGPIRHRLTERRRIRRRPATLR